MSDGMKPIIISYLLEDDERLEEQSGFHLTTAYRTLLATALFLGMLGGSIFWGKLSDTKGRKSILFWTVGLTFVMSVVAAISPWIEFLIVAELLLGFAVGGNLPVVYSLFIEFTPVKNRGFWLTILASSWSVGELIVSFFAWLLLDNQYFGWRGLVVLAGLPGLLTCFFWPWVFESPRFYIVTGRPEKAKEVLDQVGIQNQNPIEGSWNLISEKTVNQDELGSMKALLSRGIAMQTILLWLVWFLASFGLYGVLIYLPTVLKEKGIEDSVGLTFISGAGNIPGIFAGALLVETRLQRRKSMGLFAFVTMIFAALLAPDFSFTLLAIIATGAKFGLYGFWAILDGYTPESYPTSIRSIGNSVASSFARVSGLVAPIFNQLLLSKVGTFVPVVSWSAVFFIVTILVLLLPIETADMVLQNSVEQTVAHHGPSDNARLIPATPDQVRTEVLKLESPSEQNN